MEPAPYLSEIAGGPDDARAVWLTCSDGVRIRLGLFPRADAAGTVVIFTGRTEFVEKYARVAGEFGDRGFSTAVIDWRGQGLADRVSQKTPVLGHVGDNFSDYQRDVAAVMAALAEGGPGGPYFLIGHSMGGAIGLRTLIEREDFAAAVFSGPMWGIEMSPLVRKIAWLVPRIARAMGMSEMFLPGVQRESYVASAEFEDNTLTTDRAEFEAMQAQVRHDPRLALGGPSVHWLHEALNESAALSRAELPAIPALAAIGSDESIVDIRAIRALAERWETCSFKSYAGARHELMMERPEVRSAFLDESAAHFRAHMPG